MKIILGLVAIVLPLFSSASARGLREASTLIPSTTIGSTNSSSSIWDKYTREENCLYLAVQQLDLLVTATDEECAAKCDDLSACIYWTFCPTNASAGCGIPGPDKSVAATLDPGSCVLTGDDSENVTSLFEAYGAAVSFSGGFYNPVPEDEQEEGGGGEGGQGAGRRRRRLEQLDPDLAASIEAERVWDNYTEMAAYYIHGIDALAYTFATSPEDCCQQCNQDPQCQYCAFCGDPAGCEVVNFQDPSVPPEVELEGSCQLSWDGTADQEAFFKSFGTGVKWTTGYWNPWDTDTTTNTSDAGGGSLLPDVPDLGDTQPEGANDTTNATTPAAVDTVWWVERGRTDCPRWNNGTWESDGSSWAVSNTSSNVDQELLTEYVSQLCAMNASDAGAQIGADLVAGGTDAQVAFAAYLVQQCPEDPDADLQLAFLHWVSPPNTTGTDTESVIEYASAWMLAASSAGYAGCVGIASLDAQGALLDFSTVHPASGASGSGGANSSSAGGGSGGEGGVVSIGTSWASGTGSVACPAWNGTSWYNEASTWVVNSTGEALPSTEEIDAYRSQLCAADPALAGQQQAEDIVARGQEARVAVAAQLAPWCPDGVHHIDLMLWDYVNPPSNTDVERVERYATAWMEAYQDLGYAACLGIASFDEEGGLVALTQVHPSAPGTAAPVA